METKIKISFSDRREIRMGSPYMRADLKVEGLDLIIPKACWQDKFAISKDKKFIALVSFDLSENEPAFEIYIIDKDKNTITKTKRIFGLLNKIRIVDRKIMFNKFIYDKRKSKTGELCCNFDDELDIA